MNGFYAAKKMDGKVTSVFIDEEVLNFADQNRRVEDRMAAQAAIRQADRDKAMEARKKQAAKAARRQRRKVRTWKRLGICGGILTAAALAQVLGLATAWITAPIMAGCLVAAGMAWGRYRR